MMNKLLKKLLICKTHDNKNYYTGAKRIECTEEEREVLYDHYIDKGYWLLEWDFNRDVLLSKTGEVVELIRA
jgi:hypothetical protein